MLGAGEKRQSVGRRELRGKCKVLCAREGASERRKSVGEVAGRCEKKRQVSLK